VATTDLLSPKKKPQQPSGKGGGVTISLVFSYEDDDALERWAHLSMTIGDTRARGESWCMAREEY
jgi:hypothetical protein